MIAKLKIFYRENSMWIYLGNYIIISFLLAIMAISIDTRFVPIIEYIPNVFLTSVDLAKLILSTLAGSLLTITTFTFSTIMVVLTTYSSDYSPRVVNNFLTEKTTMKVLGVFIGGFFYCILVLFFMRNAYSQDMVISATIAIIYSVVCTMYFVIFVYSVSSSIQASKLIIRLYEESYEIIERTLLQREDYLKVDNYKTAKYKFNKDILSNESGYLILIEFKEILSEFKDLEVDFVIDVRMGDFVSKYQKIATVHYNKEDLDEKIFNKTLKFFTLESERVEYNDYRFSIQKIIDITLRSLSPGINDPNTAIHCINIIGVILGRLGHIKGSHIVIKDEKTKSQVVYQDFNFNEELYSTFNQISHYGKEDISVVLALFKALKTISQSSTSDKLATVNEFSDYVYQGCIGCYNNKLDIERLERAKQLI